MSQISQETLEMLREKAIRLLLTAEDNQLVQRAEEARALLIARQVLSENRELVPKVDRTPAKPPAPRQFHKPIQAAAAQPVDPKPLETKTAKPKQEKTEAVRKAKVKEEEAEVKRSTDYHIRKVMNGIKQPFKRHDIYKALRWAGVNDITEAAVSGWVNRAVKRGELVPAATVGEYKTDANIPEGLVAPPMPAKLATSHKAKKPGNGVGSAVQGNMIGDLEIVSGGGSIIKD